jgi:hypothetical protein
MYRHIDGFGLVGFMVLNATFNNISVISWQSVFLVEETSARRNPFYYLGASEILLDNRGDL